MARPRKGHYSNCKNCGIEIYDRPSWNRLYCSYKCRGSHLKIWNKGKTDIYSKETREKMGASIRGKKHMAETRLKMSKTHKERVRLGLNNFWKGGITKKSIIIRSSFKYKNWREKVFERDDYTCKECGAKNGNGVAVHLQAHHIKSFADNSKLRFDVNNGITLCIDCHKKTDTYLKVKDNLEIR